VIIVNKIFLSSRVYSTLCSLAPRERLIVRKALSQLRQNPGVGIRLWGRDDLYLYETGTEAKIIYGLAMDQVQVLGIRVAKEYRPPSRERISAIVLAAGKTGCMDSQPVSYLAEALLSAGIDDLVFVLGSNAEQAKRALCSKDVKIIVNPDYEHGLSKSLRYGLKMVSQESSAVLLTLGNRPFITANMVGKLVRAYAEKKASVVVPTYSQMRGHPVVFDAVLVPELFRARGNAGGRGVLWHHSRELRQVEMEDAGILEKIWEN
jgi:CTP:molybdopterin cytidylyltransferase MocA